MDAQPPPPATPPPAPGGPLRAAWHLLQPVLAVALALALVAGALGWALLWLLRSEEGTAWLFERLPGIEARGVRGALLSERFALEHLVVRWDRGRAWVSVDGLQGEGLQWDWHPAPGAWVGLRAQRLQARRVEVQTGPAGRKPTVMPRSLQLPLRLDAGQVQVDALHIEALAPMTRLRGHGLRLWEPGGREYQVERVSFDWDRARIDGQVSLGALPPFTLQAEAAASAIDPALPWTARAQARGPLARLEVQGTLRGTAPRGAVAPELDLAATVTPLEAWPLGSLRLRTQALDLAALSSAAPRTALKGRADIESSALDGPLTASVVLENTAPGRWNDGRAPLRRLQATLRSPDADRARLLVEDFDIEFAAGAEDAGRWQGSAQWAGPRLRVDSRVEALRPQLLDSRATTMNLSGPLAFTLTGARSPQPSAGSAGPTAARTLDLQTTLEGRIEGSPVPVTLHVDALADAQRIELRALRAEVGAARAQLTAQASRGPQNSWQLRSSGELTDFDPVPWWPGRDGSAWRTGPHRLNGSWSLDVTLPRIGTGTAPLALLQGLAGSGSLRIDRSQLAGVPLAAQVELGYQGSAGTLPGSVSGELVLGGNRLQIDGRGDPLGNGAGDRLSLDLQARDLPGLAPLLRLQPELAPWQPRSGRVEARATLEGRWPDVRSEGSAVLQALQAANVGATRAQANWRFDTAEDQPLLLQAEAQGLQHGAQRIETLRADLRGTWRQHRLELTAALPAQPPRALELALGLRTSAGTLAQLRADGAWDADGAGGGRWQGRVTDLGLGPWGGPDAPAPAGPGSAWLQAAELRTELRWHAQDGLTEWQAAAGQVRLADATTLRWDEVRVDLRGAAPSFRLRADVEPFAVAPLLARAQPDLGWSGDLRLTARVDLRVAEKVDADLVFERRDGDLRLAEEAVSVPFGLNELRVAASAHEGHWQLAGAFAGQALGQASARLNLRTRPDQRWPDADTPIDGLIDAQVANLGIWGTWVPPGWRLSGELRTQARVGGRVGAPEYAGEVRARGVAVRNLLLGVDVSEGEALVQLRGARAEIERFTLRGGDGTLAISGHAQLAGQPGATLALKAERFRVLGRVDRQLSASAQLQLQVGGEQPSAEGSVRVDEGLFDLGRSDAPSLDDDVSIRQGPAPAAEARSTAAPARTRRFPSVAIDLDLGERLRVRGRGLDTTLGGNLKLGAAAGRLTLHGIVNAAGGTYAAYGQKLDIERGLVIFSGPPDNPALDVLALRPNLDTQVGVAITGTIDAPRVRLYSSTDMSESDKLSWLVLGRPSEGLGRADTTLLQRAAVALLAGEGEAPTDTLMRNLGLDQLSVRQSDSDVRETVVSLGKQLSRRWYVGYERGINATAGTWQLIYRIAQRFTLRAQSGLENSLDLIWVWRLERDPLVAAPVPKSAASAPP